MGCGASAAPEKYKDTSKSSEAASSGSKKAKKSKAEAYDAADNIDWNDDYAVTKRPSVTAMVNLKNKRMQAYFVLGSGEGGVGSFTRPVEPRELARVTEKKTNVYKACRTVRKHRMDGHPATEEVDILTQFDHPNILKILEVFEDDVNLYHIFPFPQGGKLTDRLESAGDIAEEVVAHFATQILKGIAHMHALKICHRGLSLDVLYLMDEEPLVKSLLKIGDFQFATEMKDEVRGMMESVYEWSDSPWRFMAPEMIHKAPIYFLKADVWAAGVFCYVLLAGELPFRANELHSIEEYRHELYDYSTWLKDNRTSESLAAGMAHLADASDAAKKFVKTCLQEMDGRCAAQDALELPWLKSAGKRAAKSISPKALKGLKNYSNMNELQKKISQVIATRLPDEEIKELQKLFAALDQNNDGVISMNELADGLKQRPKKGQARKTQMEREDDLIKQVLDLMTALDTDGSRGLSYTEFMAACLDERHLAQEDMGWAAFRYFDKDGSGTVTREELVTALKEMDWHDTFPAHGIALLFKEADSDGSKEIEFHEFMSMIQPGKDWSHLQKSASPKAQHKTARKSAKGNGAKRCALCQQKRQVQDWKQDGQLICSACWMQN
mmetsp:Transcript_66803/g.118268  ORF Transcript_66803/g.118268 Transcript_66803/m.118268 type:complete len:611 (-) Transcript_66803:131-1963(-)|eukprot:CAMPEP_0197624356 /NCGR_PEP_ID=MMETSP1338-20131121/4028_1 /TAXON_ID=43686 ORGANISM="Pelagodinium beii, Strain RCC1491" /NCGR_SAMPLE_ID=MMETSP1338 /ASSEMBLY_ACC=CAM_ASM_000754 /LENGTH=610 /DNA_ID=CAMNT_0043194483 /DNA_START=24 /DNA_END=1856 /DNA_ORIENTATION=+